MDLRACPAGECRSFIRTDIYIRICTHMRIKITFKLAILLRGLLFILMFQSILTALRSSSCSPLFFFLVYLCFSRFPWASLSGPLTGLKFPKHDPLIVYSIMDQPIRSGLRARDLQNNIKRNNLIP